ncbi:hypothetical protein D9615_000979 [Tricholomella constricta]|uniref:Ribosomal eL28/Mak16 domain-containing protein n=1 Tax=Tricholomella constricta TaxID=117010 RepID=A0A8H5HKQ0_9AGAR|nr:hypothetical protein D9615_000979 [Tricholomella constricta]
MSSDLQWLLLRKNNSFMVQRVVEGPVFSKEPGNLRNLHSFKYSGLANPKTIDVADSPEGIQITTRKTKATPNAVRSAYAKSTIRPRSGPRRAAGVASQPARRGYRPDLRATQPVGVDQTPAGTAPCRYRAPFVVLRGWIRLFGANISAAVARVSALLAAQKEPKPSPAKKIRGHKAKVLETSLE